MNKTLLFLLSSFLFLVPITSYAYIGPGMGGGLIAAFIGFIAALILGILAILYYPIKRALKMKTKKKLHLNVSDNEHK
jgi:hypothetical protein